MKLSGLRIKNYRRIGSIECEIRIDEIVVLVGQNNSGKSTVLDAYEAFASSGGVLDESHFHNRPKLEPIEIVGIFTDLSEEDIGVLGKKWQHNDTDFGPCIKVKWIWKQPDEKGQKQAFNPESNEFEDGGLGGWDSLLQSRIPQPIRIRPTDPPGATQDKIVSMLKEHVKASLKANSDSTKTAFEQIDALAKKIFSDSKAAFDEVADKITTAVNTVFPGTTIELIPRSKDNLDEKVIGADSYIRVGTREGVQTPLDLQGTGVQRALLWSALSVMSDAGNKKKKAGDEVAKILLIDEPEAFLHPPTIRGARESLYEFALNNQNWQVIATTHSPIFIDLSRDHTSIVRVDASSGAIHYVSTDKISFDVDEKTKLQMVRACNPVVNEFFFYDNIVLVEGATEQIVVQHMAEKLDLNVHVINCLGKANIPLFARILNQFRVPYLVIHDSDTPKVLRKGKYISASMWTINERIRSAVAESNQGCIFTQFPHFEGEFLNESLSSGKVDRVLEALENSESDEYEKISYFYENILKRSSSIMTTSSGDFDKKMCAYIESLGGEVDERWT